MENGRKNNQQIKKTKLKQVFLSGLLVANLVTAGVVVKNTDQIMNHVGDKVTKMADTLQRQYEKIDYRLHPQRLVDSYRHYGFSDEYITKAFANRGVDIDMSRYQ